MGDTFEELLQTIERNTLDNKIIINNVKLFVKSWRKERELALTIPVVNNRYRVTNIKLADFESVSIGDTKTNKVLCYFVTENGFNEAIEMAKKITKFLNGC